MNLSEYRAFIAAKKPRSIERGMIGARDPKEKESAYGDSIPVGQRMKQSRRMSLVESVTNVAVGYLVALGAQLLVFPWFGLTVSLRDNALIGAAFTVVSIARSFALRRLFEAIRVRR